ncbi:hypothetical protein [Absidia glauca]|uniref:Uncharacterized protein n=1 Tax=Absidia glauca TaxID=4829 RepID=A0A168SGK0_ABSGL|nr:hypothetical protein [Absidia glauca]
MRKGKLVSDTKSVGGSEQKKVGKRVVMFSSAMATESTVQNRPAPYGPNARRRPLGCGPYEIRTLTLC